MFPEVVRKLQTVDFDENSSLNQIPLPTDSPISRLIFNLVGTITINTGSPNGVPETTLFEALCNALGLLTIQGTVSDGSKGIRLNNIPFALLNYFNYLLTANPPQAVTLPNTLTQTTYNINLAVPLYFYDPKTPAEQWAYSYFRGARYSNPYIQIQTGFIEQATGGQNDQTAFVGTDAYTYDLQVQVTAYQVPSLKMSAKSKCFDISFEYAKNFGILSNLSDGNGITLSDRGLQGYLMMFNTGLVTATGQEVGINNLGINGGGFIETRFGNNPKDFAYPASLQSIDQQEFLAATQWPDGPYVFDDYNHSFSGWRNKTLLNQAGIYYLDTNPGSTPNGDSFQNIRTFHFTYNPSTTLLKAVPRLKSYQSR